MRIGYTREEVVGKTFLELGVWRSASDRERMIRAVQEQGRASDLEFSFRRKDGTEFVALFSAEFIFLQEETYLLSMLKDITRRKELEAQIAVLNQDLEERALALEAANQELEAFNYTVAHDLRKPISTITSACQVLETLCGDALEGECRDYLQYINQGAWRMNELIDALLRFSRVGHFELDRQTVDLSALAEEAALTLHQAEPGREVEFRIVPGLTASGDAGLLGMVLENLMGNAWKHTRDTPRARIEFAAEESGGVMTYRVRDNGEGFDMASATSLFQPFRQLEGAGSKEGFGIGLATVERIIRRHGGKVWAESRLGGGATFFFTLA